MLSIYYLIASGVGFLVFYIAMLNSISGATLIRAGMEESWTRGDLAAQLSAGLPALVLWIAHAYLLSRRKQSMDERALQYFYVYSSAVVVVGLLIDASALLRILINQSNEPHLVTAYIIRLVISSGLWIFFFYRLRKGKVK